MNDVEKLLAIEEIKQLKARYFRFVDTKDWQGFEELFTEDAVLDIRDDIPDCVVTGAAEIVNTVSSNLVDVTSVHHGHCPEIEISSDNSATGIWAMEDKLRWSEDSTAQLKNLHGYGHYLETYARVNDNWRIKTLKLKRLRVDIEHKT